MLAWKSLKYNSLENAIFGTTLTVLAVFYLNSP